MISKLIYLNPSALFSKIWLVSSQKAGTRWDPYNRDYVRGGGYHWSHLSTPYTGITLGVPFTISDNLTNLALMYLDMAAILLLTLYLD